MAEHNWPAGLPCFALSSYSGGGEDGVIRSQFPAGTKTRPRFTKPPAEQVRALLFASPAQLQTILDFWEITLKRVLPFNYRDVTKPNDMTTVEYRFLARPSYSAVNQRRYRVELQLEQLTTFQGTFPLGDGGGSLLGDGSGDAIST